MPLGYVGISVLAAHKYSQTYIQREPCTQTHKNRQHGQVGGADNSIRCMGICTSMGGIWLCVCVCLPFFMRSMAIQKRLLQELCQNELNNNNHSNNRNSNKTDQPPKWDPRRERSSDGGDGNKHGCPEHNYVLLHSSSWVLIETQAINLKIVFYIYVNYILNSLIYLDSLRKYTGLPISYQIPCLH